MKTLLLIAFILVLPLTVKAHDYFFSFVEMEYNAVTQRIEMTLTLTTHDFERAMAKNGEEIKNIRSLNEIEKTSVESYINTHFKVTSGSEKSTLNFMGNDISLDGTSHWYFESEPMNFLETIEIRYDVLMEAFPEQQNKVTLYYAGKTYTAAFTPMDKTKQLYFENKEQ